MVFMSAGDRPMESLQAEEILKGQKPSLELFQAVSEKASTSDIDPGGDIHASKEFRVHLAKVLSQRALQEAFNRAREN